MGKSPTLFSDKEFVCMQIYPSFGRKNGGRIGSSTMWNKKNRFPDVPTSIVVATARDLTGGETY